MQETFCKMFVDFLEHRVALLSHLGTPYRTAVFDKQNNQNTALQLFNFPKNLLNAKENRFIPIKDGMYISTTH